MREIIFRITESGPGEYQAQALEHSIYTTASSMEELKIMIKDAVHCHFEPDQIPKVANLHFVKDETIAL